MPRVAKKTTTTATTKTTRTTKTTAPRVVAAPVAEAAKSAPKPKATENRKKLHEECRKKLLKAKADHLSHFDQKRVALTEHMGGDDGDLANAAEEQDIQVSRRESLLNLLGEIESALERLDNGTYGVCEETEEIIEAERLLAIPWTRLSLDGAIAREREQKDTFRRRVG